MSSIALRRQFQKIHAPAAIVATVAVALFAVFCPAARADFVTFATPSGDKSASAVFTLAGDLLTIKVTNTSTPTGGASTTGGGQIVTELMFDTNLGSSLTPDIDASGSAATASAILGSYPSGITSIGANWAIEGTSSGAPQNTVISSTGVDDDGNPRSGYFATVPKTPLDGPNFGIAADSYGSDLANGFTILAQNSITFSLIAKSFSLSDLGNKVTFVFGTGGSDTSLITGTPMPGPSPVPEPTSLTLWSLMGLAGVTYARRKKRAASYVEPAVVERFVTVSDSLI